MSSLRKTRLEKEPEQTPTITKHQNLPPRTTTPQKPHTNPDNLKKLIIQSMYKILNKKASKQKFKQKFGMKLNNMYKCKEMLTAQLIGDKSQICAKIILYVLHKAEFEPIWCLLERVL